MRMLRNFTVNEIPNQFCRLHAPRLFRQSDWATARCGFSLTELLVVTALLSVLAVLGGRWVAAAQARALTTGCAKNLAATGALVATYQSPQQFGRIPLAGDHTAYNTDAATLDPFICMWKAGLLREERLLNCPAGAGPYVYGASNPQSVPQLGGPGGPRAAVRLAEGGGCASNYLFTLGYAKDGAAQRVIAGDAAAAGYSPNHGDREPGDASGRSGRGANALRADGSVVMSGPDYRIPDGAGEQPWSADAPGRIGSYGR